MTLPNLTIPFGLPFDVPLLLHPAIIHFVIARSQLVPFLIVGTIYSIFLKNEPFRV